MGKVYLIGAGPGAADLITVRALNILKRADIVFYDALVHEETLAYAPHAKHLCVGKRANQISTNQRFISRNLVEAAQKYETVVRLKGGDPMLFGRATEELEALQAAGIKYEIVPGVTAALGASADLGVSLTQRGVSRSTCFVTPRVGSGEAEHNWVKSVLACDTAVLYMAAGQAQHIQDTLLAHGMSSHMPVVVVERATLPDAQYFILPLSDLNRIVEWDLPGPTLLLIGEVFRQLAHLPLEKQLEQINAALA